MANSISCGNGLVNSPGNWFNWVDIHCVPYTKIQMVLFAGGCLMWVVAYALLIHNTRKYRFMEMAAFAAASNFAWEALWSWAFSPDTGQFMVWTYRAWFFLDIYIFYLLLTVGQKQIQNEFLKKNFKLWCIASLLGCTVIYYYFVKQGYDMPIGANTAYICQIILSILCPLLLLNATSMDGFSFHFAWLRGFGTAANTVFMFLHYPENHFVHALGVMAFLLDMGYLALFKFKSRQLQNVELWRQASRTARTVGGRSYI